MAPYCIVPGCNTTAKSGVMMHRFKRNKEDLLEKWLCAIKRIDLANNLPKLLQKRVCDLHFSDKQKFASTSRNRTNLLYDAVPDSNLPEELADDWRKIQKFNPSTEDVKDPPEELTDWRNIQKLNTFTQKVTDLPEESTNWKNLIDETLSLWPSLVDNETTAFPSVATVGCVIEAVNDKQLLREISHKNRELNNERMNDRLVGNKSVNEIAMNQCRSR